MSLLTYSFMSDLLYIIFCEVFMSKPAYCYRLKKLREANGYTQSDVAIILGIRQEQYSKYESGIHQLPIHLLIKLSKIYKVTSDYILDI